MTIDFDGFQIMIDILKPMIINKKLFFIVDRKDKNNKYSVIVYMLNSYLK
jgi:hypothetical protein